MSTWKYMHNGQQCGPVDTAALTSMLSRGTLGPETPVWQEGMPDWVPLRTLPEFSGAAPGSGTPPASSGSGTAAPGIAPTTPGEVVPDPADVEKNKVFAVLAYIGLLFLVPLLAAPQSQFARYHTNQGLVLFLAAIVCFVGGFIISMIPFVGCLVMPAIGLGLLAMMIMGIINAANGKCKPLPVIGQFTLLK